MHNVWYWESTNNLFLNTQVMKFMDLVQYKTTQMMFKTSNNMLPNNIQNLFRNREGKYDLRGQCNLKIKSMCITVCGVTLWNGLDGKLKFKYCTI